MEIDLSELWNNVLISNCLKSFEQPTNTPESDDFFFIVSLIS